MSGVKLSTVKNEGAFRFEVNLQEAWDEENEPRQFNAHDGAVIVLREPTSKESAAMAENNRLVIDKLEDFIVEHPFEKEDGTPETPKNVADYVRSSITLSAHVMREVVANLPLHLRSGGKSET